MYKKHLWNVGLSSTLAYQNTFTLIMELVSENHLSFIAFHKESKYLKPELSHTAHRILEMGIIFHFGTL